MPLVFAGISPHPPILLPEIGKSEDLAKVVETSQALNKLGRVLNEAEIDTLIIISPHMLVYPDKFNICGIKKLFGTFASFDAPEVIVEYDNDLDLANQIFSASQKEGIDALLYDNNSEFFEMDHGLMVPLYFLSRQQESKFKVLPIAYSFQDKTKHFALGQIIGEIAKKNNKRIGILASGDFSHQLIQKPQTKYYDEKLISDLKNKNTEDILFYEDEIIDEWSECGFRSVLILLGALDGLNYTPEIISYEGPFGVGYIVANFNLPEN